MGCWFLTASTLLHRACIGILGLPIDKPQQNLENILCISFVFSQEGLYAYLRVFPERNTKIYPKEILFQNYHIRKIY